MVTFTEGAAKALAELIHQLRPAWDRQGVLAAIHRAHRPGRDLQLIAHIAIDAACDQTVRTPGVIATRDRTQVEPDTPTTSPADRHLCPSCRRIHDPGQATCKRTTAETAARGAAAARAALAAAPRTWELGDDL